MIRLLEQGQRRPSASLAESLIRAYGMTDAEAAPVRAAAIPFVGRDSPYKRGWRPAPANYRPRNQNGGQPVLGPRRNAPQGRQGPQEAAPPRDWTEAYDPAPDSEDNPWAAVYGDHAAETERRLGALRSPTWRRT
jgi:hypothetical protein